jgi:hypothetical protein
MGGRSGDHAFTAIALSGGPDIHARVRGLRNRGAKKEIVDLVNSGVRIMFLAVHALFLNFEN